MIAACILCGAAESRRVFRKGGRDFIRCGGCGLMRVDPLPTSAELAAYYAQTYDEGLYAPYAAAHDIRWAIAAYRFRTLGPLTRPGRWLDVGCGAGHFVTTAAAVVRQGQPPPAPVPARPR